MDNKTNYIKKSKIENRHSYYNLYTQAILLAVSLAVCVTSRPLEEDAENVATRVTAAPSAVAQPGRQGSFLGEVMVMSEDVTVKRTRKTKKSSKSSQEGPQASALVATQEVSDPEPEVSGPEPEVSDSEAKVSDPEAVVSVAVGTGKDLNVGVKTGSASIGNSPGISISGATITFNRPAQVIQVSP
ncbi:uncharacterized protein LOC122266779 [Penaeus japonicus]|uniref:uncharacterized protein LOC122266779 n=1 Tax=Penaeus japonicus TaxID=27405 RepID=UPI001C712AF6|nr:uncharacterized protein LOC122266779 [Penaeus japonicus]